MEKTGYNSLQNAVTDLFGEDVSVKNSVRAYGGDINDSYRIALSDGETVFMKRNASQPPSFFMAEARGLTALGNAGKIKVPKVFGVGTDPGYGSFLLMEYIPSGRRGKDYWEIFGHQLAELHRSDLTDIYRSCGAPTVPAYGFPKDNSIGETLQVNAWRSSWPDFYRECRLEVQIRMAEDYFDSGMLKLAGSLLDHLDRWIFEPEFPSLLHGDLWGGNAMCSDQSEPVLIDPAVYIGHFETDLAMTELFGGFSEAFYRAYQEVTPIPPGYYERRDIYQLYHLLNHLNLFGESYYGDVCRLIRRYGR